MLVTPATEQTSAFLDVPMDVHCIICDELPLPATILLSQTCKAMWYMLRDKCSVQSKALYPKDRFNTLTELGNLLPDHYHCIRCNILHLAEPDEIPDMTNWHSRRRLCPRPAGENDTLRPHPSYAVSFHHVQLALKYSRMKGKHQDCRANILQKFEIHPVGSPLMKTFTAKPKIVNARFILLATYVLYADPLRNAAKKDWDNVLTFCPHEWYGVGTGPNETFAKVMQMAAIEAETTQGQHTELFSCDRCPTDFSVVVEDGEAVVKAWYDLGLGFSVKDPSWQSHLGGKSIRMFKEIGYQQFDYEHGSISKMYDSCYE